MGYRQDIALAISDSGWKELDLIVKNLSDEDKNRVISLFYDADVRKQNDDGDKLFFMEQIKWDPDIDFVFTDVFGKIKSEEYLAIILGEDGNSNYYGDYYDNPFETYIVHKINIDDSDDDMSSSVWKFAIAKADMNAAPVCVTATNDHTCPHCGNDKCSKSETTCWKCGGML